MGCTLCALEVAWDLEVEICVSYPPARRGSCLCNDMDLIIVGSLFIFKGGRHVYNT